MANYVKKGKGKQPIVEARQYVRDMDYDLAAFARASLYKDHLRLYDEDGDWERVDRGDWVVRDYDFKISVLNHRAFTETYREA